MMIVGVRLAVSFGLLYFVWTNSHWAVALCVTVLFIRAELEDWVDRRGDARLDGVLDDPVRLPPAGSVIKLPTLYANKAKKGAEQ